MMKRLRCHLSIYCEFIRLDMKRLFMYPVDFMIGNLGFFLDTISNLFVLYIIMSTTTVLGDFNVYQMLFFYSFLMCSSSIWEIFFVTILEIPYMIRTGELDIFLLRPLNILFQFIIFQIDEESVLEAVFGIGLMVFSISQLPSLWHVPFMIKCILFFISSLFIRHAIYLALSSVAFWSVSNDGLKSILWELSQLANYPLSLYPVGLRAVLVILPFGFVGYFPVKNLLFNNELFDMDTLLNATIGFVVFLFVYQTIWKWGLKKYQSIGG